MTTTRPPPPYLRLRAGCEEDDAPAVYASLVNLPLPLQELLVMLCEQLCAPASLAFVRCRGSCIMGEYIANSRVSRWHQTQNLLP